MESNQIISADHDRAAWLRWRKGGIGGSDAAAIMGHGYKRRDGTTQDALAVYADKVSDAIDDVDSLILRRGRELEPLAAARYVEETGRDVRRQPVRIHRDFDFIRCSIDRQILAGANNPTGLLEIKTANAFVFRKMKMDGIPIRNWIQVQHNLETWDYDFGAIAVLQPDSWEFIRFDIARDRDFCRRLVEAEGEFWSRVQERRPPIVAQEKADAPPAVGGELIRAESFDAVLAEQFANLSDSLKVARRIKAEADEFADDVADRFKLWLTSNAFDVVEGNGVRVYYKEQAGRASFDKKALAAAHPEINLAAFEKKGSPFRTFRVFDAAPKLTEGGF